MPRATPVKRLHTTLAVLALLGAMASPNNGEAAVTTGGIAIVGYTDNSDGFDDSFSIVALEEIAAGTTVYFTDNGWSVADGKFRGANNTDGDGNERLIRLSFSSNLAAGTVMRSGVNIDFVAQWDNGATIPGSLGDTFQYLNLDSSTSDQIHAFEANASLPLLNPTNQVFLLDFGDYSNPGFEDAIDNATGNLAPGVSLVANTAVTLPDNSGVSTDPNDFHNGSFALNMADADVVALNGVGGTKAQWLALIADSSNWLRINYEDDPFGDAEGTLTDFTIAGVPEPSRALLAMAGALVVGFRRRRHA